MASLEELRDERLKKISLLQAEKRSPYPISVTQDYSLAEVKRTFGKLKKRLKPITLVGRVLGVRGQGNLNFFDLYDGTGRLQGLAKRDELGEKEMDLFEAVVDRGDFLEVTGSLFLTKSNEPTILVKEWRLIAKSLRPLPDKWHGLVEMEDRFRERYLDSLMNEEVRARFELRSLIIRSLRAYLDDAGYLEVETPMLQSLPGGATAQPFKTHHEALDNDFYLRISPELYLKEMLIAGFPRVYELSRSFRNEGIDLTHNPEFTTLEFYEAYSDALKQRIFVEKLFKLLVKQFGQKMTLTYSDEKIDFKPTFKVLTYYDLFKSYALITDPAKMAEKELSLKASQLGVILPAGASRAKILDLIYKKVCRPKLIQPTFIIDYPKNYLPLAKTKTDNPELADAFQLVIGGLELVKAFSELNDPIEQKERFRSEEKNRQAGESETQPFDNNYVKALEYGLPPAGGVGIGVDRLVMLFTNTTNIREVIFFPTLKPKG